MWKEEFAVHGGSTKAKVSGIAMDDPAGGRLARGRAELPLGRKPFL